MGLPFVPIFGLIGSDLFEMGPDYRIIDNPYIPGQQVVVAPALRPNVVALHAPQGDVYGNVILPGNHQAYTAAMAGDRVVVTVEELVAGELTAADAGGDVFIPGIYVTAVAQVPHGAHPAGCPPLYGVDDAHMREYMAAARDDERFRQYLDTYVYGAGSHAEYLEKVGVAS